MRRLVAPIALAAFLAAILPPEAGFAKPRGCFTKAEQAAEQMVRLGLRLREGGQACDGPPWEAGTQPLWDDVDKQFGPRFAQQTQIRAAAFVREFEKDAENKLAIWNARIVFFYRNYPLSAAYCAGIKSMLADIQQKGWPIFVKQSRLARDEIRMTYKPCD